MNDTYSFIKPLNDSNVVFVIGDSPTVTFNENVTVYSYPKEPIHIELNPAENTNTNTNTNTNIHTKQKNIFKKIVNKISNFRI